MKEEKQSYTDLLKLINTSLLKCEQTLKQKHNYLYSYQHIANIQSRVQNTMIRLNVLQKGQLMYLTDLKNSIQAEYRNKNIQTTAIKLQRSPINIIETNYYALRQNVWHPFNCRRQFLQQEDELNCPYQPRFYFNNDYAEFCRLKQKKQKYFLPCKSIVITKWCIKLVNISRTGWYGPIIEVIDFTISQKMQNEDFTDISCIIYESKIRRIMEKIRLKQLRKPSTYKMPEHEQKQVSILYFLKDKDTNSARKKIINIFQVNQQILKFKQNNNLKYILFGLKQQEGILTLQVPLNQSVINHERIKIENLNSLRNLFNSRQQQKLCLAASSEDEDSDDEESYILNEPMIDQNEEESDDEDPLRNLYINQLKRISLH